MGRGRSIPGRGSVMATNTAWATSLLDKAAAIVEAEWIRLQQDAGLWERELADLSAEMPAPRPGPPRVSATTTRAGAPTHRCQRTVAGGRRGNGPRRRYGLPPNDLLRRPRCPVRKALSDCGGDATTDDHHQATTPVSPTNDSDVASPRPTPACRVGLRTHRHSWWHIRSGPCTPSLPSPGRPRDGFRPVPAGHPGIPRKRAPVIAPGGLVAMS